MSAGASGSLIDLESAEWLAFVAGCRDATPFHHPSWARGLADCYGLRPFAVVVRDEAGAIAAGVPVIETRGVRSRRWIALPFTDACPPLGDPALVSQLAGLFDDLRQEAGIAVAEIRGEISSNRVRNIVRGVTHTLALGPDPDVVRRTFDRSQVQRGIVRSERDGVVVRQGQTAGDLTETFYNLHLLTRRRLGVPIQPRRFFELLWERLLEPGLGWVQIAEHESRPVAAAVFLSWNRTLVYKLGASDPDHRACRPNHAIFWHAIRRGCEEGARTLDFGRTDTENVGLRNFKGGWGTIERDLVYASYGNSQVTGRGSRAALSTVIRHSPPWVCQALGERLYRYAA